MKEYPSIAGSHEAPELPCIAFYKHDGSNLRFEWQRKAGWCKFGTRRRLFGPTDPEYAPAIEIFMKKYAEGVEKVIHENKHFRGVREVICYCEYFGPNSFGGQHDPRHPAISMTGATTNDPMDLVLFDVNLHKKGFVPPPVFVDTFEHLGIPAVIYQGLLTQEFVQDVRDGKYPLVEGVVCKGGEGHRLWMCKIKTQHYLDELKRRFGTGWEAYGE